MKNSSVTVCVCTSTKQKAQLNKWADEDERSVSYIIRKLITNEAKRREEAQTKKAIQN